MLFFLKSCYKLINYILFIFVLALSNCANSSTIHKTVPIDQLAHQYMAELHLAGLALAKIKFNSKNNSYDVWHKEYGYSNLEEKKPITPHTQFLLASVTKTFTGLVVANAIEDRLLSLDTNINEILKQFKVDNPNKELITMRDLVTHQSKIIDSENYLYTDMYRDANNELQSLHSCCGFEKPLPYFSDLKERHELNLLGYLKNYVSHTGLLYSASNFSKEASNYSNTGAALAGYIVEQAYGKKLEDVFWEKIFSPLNMQDTTIASDTIKQNNIATQYLYLEGKQIALPTIILSTWPDGGVRSSITDLSNYLGEIMLAYKGSKSAKLPINVVRLALQPITDFGNGKIGIFWQTEEMKIGDKIRRLIGHDGEYVGAFSFMLYDMDNDEGIIVLANGNSGQDIKLHLELFSALFDI